MPLDLPKVKPAPPLDLPPKAIAGQRALDKDEIVGEIDFGETKAGDRLSRGVSLREARGYDKGKRYNDLVGRMVNEPRPDIVERTSYGGGKIEAPVSERFKGPPKPKRGPMELGPEMQAIPQKRRIAKGK